MAHSCPFPPIAAFTSASVGFFLAFWGLWNLGTGYSRTRYRLWLALFSAVIGTTLWGYGVMVILLWSVGGVS